jgi:hypothetical protein
MSAAFDPLRTIDVVKPIRSPRARNLRPSYPCLARGKQQWPKEVAARETRPAAVIRRRLQLVEGLPVRQGGTIRLPEAQSSQPASS